MCRMIAYCGDNAEDLRKLFAFFRDGSQCDPKVKAAFQGCEGHPHGWGYVLHNGGGLAHYRTARPVWEDDAELPPLRPGKIWAILHSRLTGEDSILSPLCSHPFVAPMVHQTIYLAHNGGLVKPPGVPAQVVDSEWTLGELVKEPGGLAALLPSLKAHQPAALNLFVFTVPRAAASSPVLQGLYYHERPDREDYYQVYAAELPGGRALISSTFADNVKAMGATVRKLSLGEIVTL